MSWPVLLAIHADTAQCAACHSVMEPEPPQGVFQQSTSHSFAQSKIKGSLSPRKQPGKGGSHGSSNGWQCNDKKKHSLVTALASPSRSSSNSSAVQDLGHPCISHMEPSVVPTSHDSAGL